MVICLTRSSTFAHRNFTKSSTYTLIGEVESFDDRLDRFTVSICESKEIVTRRDMSTSESQLRYERLLSVCVLSYTVRGHDTQRWHDISSWSDNDQ